jgi:general stress protein YciG
MLRVAQAGGRAVVQKLGSGHMAAIGSKGGCISSADRDHMAEIGRKGGKHLLRKGLSRLPLALACLFAGRAFATETFQSVGSQALPLVQSGGTARAMAMGSTYVGVAEGSASLLWNPAGLGGLKATELALHHNSGLGDTVQEIGVFGMPLGRLGGFGASINYVNSGSFDSRDSIGNLTGSYSASNIGASVGMGRECLPGLDLGASLKANQLSLADQGYSSVALDLGALWTSPVPGLKAGLAYSNIGTSVAGRSLASGLKVGASMSLDPNAENRVLLAASTEIQQAGVSRLQLGAEDTLFSMLALRAGYQLNLSNADLSGLTGLTAGFGFTLKQFLLDYAYLPFGELGASHRFSVTYEFGSGNKS